MSSNITPEKIKMLQRAIAHQKRYSHIFYAMSIVMLLSSIIMMTMDSKKVAALCALTGLYDCYLGDKARKYSKEIRDALKTYKDKQKEHSK